MAKSQIEIALEQIDKDIETLQYHRRYLLSIPGTKKAEAPKAKRGRKKKAGMPPETNGSLIMD